ncbi:MAG: glycosyltransferase family 2 protein [Bacteroidetes bacterium]|nr:glycosyltransferase family 2 protein [Bacteroidota bacterium]
MTEVAVVILNFNGIDLLRKFLPSVIRNSTEAHIVVVDNGSTDGSASMMAIDFPSVQLIRIEKNLGFCGGYNLALKQIGATYYLLLNSDVEVTPGWITPLVNTMKGNPKAGAVQPKILAWKNKTHFEYAGAAGGMIDSLGYPFCRGRLFHSLEEDQGQYNDLARVFWASGACIMVRSEVFHAIGGLDEEFFAHMEEIDLCWRMQRNGHEVYYQGASTVYHVGGGTLSAANPRKTYLNFRNGLSLLYKNLPTFQVWTRLPVRILLDWIAAFKFSLTGQLKDGLAVFRAHRDFFLNWKRERIKRKAEGRLGYHRPETFYSGSIVWQYFVLGKRKYSELN